MSLRLRPMILLASWGTLTYGVLSLANIRADLGEKVICGPWGCLPPLQALVAAHGFWAMVLGPAVVLASRSLSPSSLRNVARLMIAGGGLGIAGVAAHTLWIWGPSTGRSHWWHLPLRGVFELAMLVDLPAVEVIAAGGACSLLARRRTRAARGPAEEGPGAERARELGSPAGGAIDRWYVPLVRVAAVLALANCIGCGDTKSFSEESAEARRAPSIDKHEHRPGSHGGLLVPIDGAHYHVEAIATSDGLIRLHMLGEDESRVEDVEAQTVTAYARALDSGRASTITFEPSPQLGDAPGRTSLFIGRVPDGLEGRGLSVVVPSIRIAGQRLRFGFEAGSADHGRAMPEKVVDEGERELYLTPGGKYTDRDIAANGGITASRKFAGFRATHDPDPKPGDRICPITETRANPACTWIVGGKTYEFCCPPCVDEFLRQAKERPGSIGDPDSYVAR